MSKFSTIAIIVAAGSGSRFGGHLPKQYGWLGGRPVLAHSLNTLANHPKIDAVVAVIHQEHRNLYERALATSPFHHAATLLPPIIGGKERQDSVRLALEAISPHGPARVLVHDAARPFLTAELIDRLLAAEGQAVIPALEVVDTLRDLSGKTLDRTQIRRIQTPQVFDYAVLKKLHAEAKLAVTDDAALFEAVGLPMVMVAGDVQNEKITRMEDLQKMQQQLEATMETRVGMGFDVHAFTSHTPQAANHIVLCGVAISHGKKLEGHSDADVGLHALVDALLGAMAEGDIGQHFPPSDAKWKGADSAQFVTYTRDLARQKGTVISHVDITLICEAPKVGPHREKMRARIAELLEISPQRVSVKATTTEKLGAMGREEGIAAQAVATLKCPVI